LTLYGGATIPKWSASQKTVPAANAAIVMLMREEDSLQPTRFSRIALPASLLRPLVAGRA
jgi:hypothetical protein